MFDNYKKEINDYFYIYKYNRKILIGLRRTVVSKLAPIAAVMLFCSADFEALAIAFERKAGRVFPRSSTVPIQKNNL